MNLQTIKSMDGKVEYVLLPVATYHALRHQITEQLKHPQENEDYEVFDPADYVENPAALARIQAGLTQEELAKLMGVTQAYVSKIENQDKVTLKILNKITLAITKKISRGTCKIKKWE
ncbi:MAG: helix-turn-helix transcriptional regulator [Legionellales bacterium]|nr:helix-turn-helix transcriptional regulator [Legionellales bacterium]